MTIHSRGDYSLWTSNVNLKRKILKRSLTTKISRVSDKLHLGEFQQMQIRERFREHISGKKKFDSTVLNEIIFPKCIWEGYQSDKKIIQFKILSSNSTRQYSIEFTMLSLWPVNLKLPEFPLWRLECLNAQNKNSGMRNWTAESYNIILLLRVGK